MFFLLKNEAISQSSELIIAPLLKTTSYTTGSVLLRQIFYHSSLGIPVHLFPTTTLCTALSHACYKAKLFNPPKFDNLNIT
jgi:hypothetical protein